MEQKQVKQYWEDRANSNPLYYIFSHPESENEDKFFQSGYVNKAWILSDTYVGKDDVVLEIGCGVGRLMFAFCNDVREIIGVDISGEYVRLGEKYADEFAVENAVFIETDGLTIPNVKDGSVNFIYSFTVFQHAPHASIITSMLKESYRVLVTGGLIKFHHNNLDSRNEGDIAFGCSYDKEDIDKLCAETGFELVDTYQDECWASYHRGWWTILKKR